MHIWHLSDVCKQLLMHMLSKGAVGHPNRFITACCCAVPGLVRLAGRVTLLIETQEEAFVAKLLVSEGQEVPVGSPVALLADEEGKIEAAAQQADLVACHVTDVYDDKVQPQDGSIRTLVWQSYLKESSRDSGGCM